jgi:hypothetical protein
VGPAVQAGVEILDCQTLLGGKGQSVTLKILQLLLTILSRATTAAAALHLWNGLVYGWQVDIVN